MTTLLVVIVVGLGGVANLAGTTPPPEIKRSAAFFFFREGTNYSPAGTCFSVSVPNLKSTNGGWFSYLVTAKHVVFDTNNTLRSNLWVRVNRWKGGTEMVEFSTPTFSPALYLDNDPSVDLVVANWRPREDLFDFPKFPVELLADRDAVSSGKIVEGDDVFFPGLFVNYYGASNNVPIIRFGRISVLPHERIPWGKQNCELYLIESTCFGGNSGSPVFIHYAMDRSGQIVISNGPRILIAGVLIGYFNDLQPLKFVNVAAVPVNANNTGISAVVPAHLVRDILFSTELKKARGE